MLEVWGRRNSSNVMTAMWTIGELGLEYKRHNVGGSFGGNDDPGYIAMNPNKVVPTIRDDENVLWESNTIARYLAAKYGQGSLWPTDPYERAQAEMWMDWCKSTIYAGFMPIFWNLIRQPADQRNPVAIESGCKSMANSMAILERHLDDQDYLGGNQLTIGDIPIGPIMYRYFNLDIDRPNCPNVEAWYQRLCDRPAFQKHGMIPFGSSFEEWGELERQGADIQ